MKTLSERAAKNCEEAREPRCRCRCGGKLHGAKRGGADASREWFEALPADDPHYVKPKAEQLVQLSFFDQLGANIHV